jgi:hypothetical protein
MNLTNPPSTLPLSSLTSELVPGLWHVHCLRREGKHASGFICLRLERGVIFRIELVNDSIRLLVNLQIFVILERINFVHPACVLDENRHLVGLRVRKVLVEFADLENVFEAIKSNLDDLRVIQG